MGTRTRLAVVVAVVCGLVAGPAAAQSTYTWGGATGGAWLTTANWSGGPAGTYPGVYAGGPANGNANDVALFTNATTNAGIDFGTAGGLFQLGAISSTSATALQVGNSSAVNGLLQLNGGTVTGITGNATLLSATAANLTIANVNTGAGTQTMGVLLGINNGVINAAATRTITISSVISDGGANRGFVFQGGGILSLTGVNTFGGGITSNAGAISINNAAALGTGTLTLGTGVSPTLLAANAPLTVANTAAVALANNIVLPAPTVATGYTFLKTAALATTGTQLGLNGTISGGNANTTLYFNTNTSGDNTTTYRLAGNNTFRATMNVNRGGIVVGSLTGLGDVANAVQLNPNNNTTLGDLRFEVAGTFANPVVFQSVTGINANANAVTLSGNLSGTAAWRVIGTGAGTLTLTGAANTNSGTLTIASGVLQVGSGGTTGSLGAAAVVDNTTLVFNRSDAPTVPNPISGTGGVTLSGSGTTTLAGPNTYTGPTAVNAGVLRVQPGALPASAVTVADAARLTVFNPGTTITVPTLALGVATGAGLGFELNGNPPAAPLGVSGTLTVAGTNPITVSSASPLSVGQFPLLAYPGAIGGAGFAGFTLGPLPPRVVANLVNNTGSNTVDLNVTAIDTIRWQGNVSGAWNINTTANWRTVIAGTSTTYLQPSAPGEPVTFNDLATGTTTVTLAAAVSPAGVTFDNSTLTYTLTGAGGIAGNAAVTKNGSATVTLATPNTATGTITINAGTLQIGDGSANGSVVGPIVNNAALVFNRSDGVTYAGSISGPGSLTKQGAGTLTLTGPNVYTGNTTIAAGTLNVNPPVSSGYAGAIDGPGAFVKSGPTTLTLSGPNTYTGGTTVAAGGLQITDGSNIGPGPLAFTGADTSLVITGTATTLANTISLGAVSGRVSIVTPNNSLTTLNGVVSGGVATTEWFFQGGASGQTTGVLVLNGVNTLQGVINVQRGPLVLGTASAAGTAVIQLDSNIPPAGSLQLAGSFTIANNVVLFSGVETLGVDAGLTAGVSGVVSSNGALGPNKVGAGTLALTGANTYTGATTVTAGTLSAATLANGGATSSIGASTSVAANLVLNGGTLQYTGPAAASTNRLLTLNVAASGIDVAAAAGALSFTATGAVAFPATPAGNRTLTLSASNTAVNTFTPLLGDGAGGQTSLSMAGPGTWALGGNNTYTGPTTVTGGVLLVNGSQTTATGPVTVGTGVANSGTLGGSGTVGGPVAVTTGGTLRAGNGTATAGATVLTLTSGLTVTGGGGLGLRLFSGTASTGTNGSSSNSPTAPTTNNLFSVTAGGSFIDPSTLVAVNATGATLTGGTAYSFRVGQTANPTPFTINTQSQFTPTGFGATPTNFNLTGDATGAVFLNFTTPVPEPAAVGLVAAAVLGLGGLTRRRTARTRAHHEMV